MIRVTEPDDEIVHVQSVLPSKIVSELKHRTHQNSVKQAISKAVYHYLICKEINQNTEKLQKEE